LSSRFVRRPRCAEEVGEHFELGVSVLAQISFIEEFIPE